MSPYLKEPDRYTRPPYLTPAERLALEKIFYEKMSIKEAAAALGKSERTVWTQIDHARRRLKLKFFWELYPAFLLARTIRDNFETNGMPK